MGHQYLASNIFLFVISIAKCPLTIPSCNSFITFKASMVGRHLFNLLSCPILYKISFFIVKGSTFLDNRCFCPSDKNSSIYPICNKIFTSFNHFGFVKNKLAFVVYSGTLEGFMTSSNLDKTSTTTWVLPSLYTIV